MVDIVTTPYTRVFLLENGAVNGTVTPSYKGLWRAQALSYGQGDLTPVRNPSNSGYGRFVTTTTIQGEADLPELVIQARYTFDLSKMLELVNIGCNHDLQVHMGQCQNPQDFNNGWTKILVLEQARISDYGTDDLGALEPGDSAPVNENVTWQGELVYEIGRLSAAEVAASQVVREIVAVAICDQAGCGGVCGSSSDGCQNVFFVSGSATGSPGLPADVIWSQDGMATSTKIQITTLAVGEQPNDAVCVGENLVVVSEDSESLHYAVLDSIFADTQTWTEVTTGFVATKGPLAAWSLGPNETWISAEAGYIYFTDDPTSGVEVQHAGSATVQDLNDIHMLDSTNGLAVGNSNAVLKTTDGVTWASPGTGPAVGVVLNACWMKSRDVLFVGSAAGVLYKSINGGATWSTVGFSGSGSGQVRDIYFVNDTVGYMSHSTSTPVGRLFRTIDGGRSWYLLPESGTMPAHDYLTSVVACRVNTVFGGGLADNGTDGVGLKLTAVAS